MSADRPRGGALTRFAVRNWVAIALVALAVAFIAQNRSLQGSPVPLDHRELSDVAAAGRDVAGRHRVRLAVAPPPELTDERVRHRGAADGQRHLYRVLRLQASGLAAGIRLSSRLRTATLPQAPRPITIADYGAANGTTRCSR